LAFPTGDAWYSLTATESYRRVHEWIQAAFAGLDLSTTLAPACSKSLPGQCFQGYEMFDVLWRGQKIAGAAQRRTRAGLLIQGSVQPRQLTLARADWQKAMCDEASAGHGAQWVAFNPDGPLAERAQALLRQKYSQAGYNQKR
jgi:lipoate-protein ligase A